MRTIAIVIVFVIACAASWRVASVISADAISMAVGMLFGVLAGIPTALLVMASNRQRSDDYEQPDPQPSAPVIILYPPQQSQPSHVNYFSGYGEGWDDAQQGPRRIALQPEPETQRMRTRRSQGQPIKRVQP